MEDLKKSLYGSRASDPMSGIFTDMINTSYDLFQPIGLLVTNKAV